MPNIPTFAMWQLAVSGIFFKPERGLMQNLFFIISGRVNSELGFNNEVACSINIPNYHGIYTVIHALTWLELRLNCYGWSPGVVHYLYSYLQLI